MPGGLSDERLQNLHTHPKGYVDRVCCTSWSMGTGTSGRPTHRRLARQGGPRTGLDRMVEALTGCDGALSRRLGVVAS